MSFMKKTVYLDTTTPSYLFDLPTPEIVTPLELFTEADHVDE